MAEESPKPKVDPGWNDPPLFSYDTRQAHIETSKKTILNKRVSFPSNAPPPVPGNPTIAGGLPLPGGMATPPKGPPLISGTLPASSAPPPSGPPIKAAGPPLNSPGKHLAKDNGDDDATDFNEDISVIQKLINSLLNDLDKPENEKSLVDVKKRLQLLEQSWTSNKLNGCAKKKIHLLLEALVNRDSATSIKLQRSLMVDFSSVCSPWMSGIRFMMTTLLSSQQNTDSSSTVLDSDSSS